MSTLIEAKLQQMGIVLPAASDPAAKYANFVQVGSLLFISGKGPTGSGGVLPKGKLGQEFTTLSVCAAGCDRGSRGC